MAEIVISTNALPEQLFRMIQTDKVKINETNGIISLTPITEIQSDCPLRGLAADSNLTVDKFLTMAHDERERIR